MGDYEPYRRNPDVWVIMRTPSGWPIGTAEQRFIAPPHPPPTRACIDYTISSTTSWLRCCDCDSGSGPITVLPFRIVLTAVLPFPLAASTGASVQAADGPRLSGGGGRDASRECVLCVSRKSLAAEPPPPLATPATCPCLLPLPSAPPPAQQWPHSAAGAPVAPPSPAAPAPVSA